MATPPFGDPNQPYDRIPGTLKTSHTPWARPLHGGKLKGLFICPYNNSREVVELAQRLDVDYTVIMNAAHSAWSVGYSEGDRATPLQGPEARNVLDMLARRRLSLGHRYDVIVIAKVSWLVIPEHIRELILAHVNRGTGLVYVTPNRMKQGWNKTALAEDNDPEFTKLFEQPANDTTFQRVTTGIPLVIMPLKVLRRLDDYRPLPKPRHQWQQASLYISSSQHGQGRILGIDYLDEAIAKRTNSSLSPSYQHPLGDHDEVIYDFSHALLARGILWATDRISPQAISVSISRSAKDIPSFTDEAVTSGKKWRSNQPNVIVERDAFPDFPVIIKVPLESKPTRVVATLRQRLSWMRDNVKGGPSSAADASQPELLPSRLIQQTQLSPDANGHATLSLPMLARGVYLLDVQTLDAGDGVIDFASTSFFVHDDQRVIEVKTDKDHYQDGNAIRGTVVVAEALAAGQSVLITANDTWGRLVHTSTTKPAGPKSFEFEITVKQPLSELWDVHAWIVDDRGVIDRKTLPVPILNNSFDEYLFMLIFAPTPGRSNWKGALHARQLRKYGINSAYVYLIYAQHELYFHNAREHLRNVVYAEHAGEVVTPSDNVRDFSVEETEYDLAEVSRMVRRVAETGKKLDPEEFPYRMGHFTAQWINGKIDDYKLAARFGSPFYTLTGENYLLGEFKGLENSGFAPTATRRFQEWCRQQFKNDLTALNREWNSDFKRWEDIRGIMLKEAVERDQLPRWVDFRYFMRSRVFSQFFIDWTDMVRRFIPDARTGRVGHDHHDFTRYRRHMASSKLYIGQEEFSEWRHALTVELPQSFGNDEGFLMAPQSMIRWQHDLETRTNRQRWPWMVLMQGLDGFDWERGLNAPTLGGEHCFTPDYSEPLPYFSDISNEVLQIQRGIGKLTMQAKPERPRVAMLWAPYNHYISRCLPFEDNSFSGTWMYNISVVGGAVSDALSMMNSIQIRPTMVGPEDIKSGELQRRGFKVLLLPYNKGMSIEEANAIREFADAGGLVIADNSPATHSQHGRRLKKPLLSDLFRPIDKDKASSVTAIGKGHAALVNVINDYTDRLEKDDFHGANVMANLLAEHANIRPTIRIEDSDGRPRRDTLVRIHRSGSTTIVGLLRAQTPKAEHPARSTLRLMEGQHIWDARTQTYLGMTDALKISLDQQPRLLVLMPSNPGAMTLSTSASTLIRGSSLAVKGSVSFAGNADVESIDQALHIRVFDSDDKELEWFRQNLIFRGHQFQFELPISLSAEPGRYRVVAEHAITGSRSETVFDVTEK
ncbi:MAG: hypothetical protein CMJ78_11155 [Planctomycetaceae bacterium]|nr:hypothetical protein [Planctomycetaceae bacterium]